MTGGGGQIGGCFAEKNLRTCSNHPTRNFHDKQKELLPLLVTIEDNEMLIDIHSLEVKGIVFSLRCNKSPNPDGMSTFLFKHY
jgi:hypothetical protein